MNALALQQTQASSLPALVREAARKLAGAETSAEVLEARHAASIVYDAAKSAARMAKAKQAHDDVIAAVYRTQADALEIEALAKRRVAGSSLAVMFLFIAAMRYMMRRRP